MGQFLVLAEKTGLLSQLSWELLWGRDCQLVADGFSFWCYYSSAVVFCKAAADQISVGMGFSQNQDSAPSQLHSAPSYSVSAFVIIKNSDSLKISLDIISSKSGYHVVPLSFKILGSILDLSLLQKTYPILSECVAHLNCKGDLWDCSTVHINKTQIAFSGLSFAQSSFWDQILLVK